MTHHSPTRLLVSYEVLLSLQNFSLRCKYSRAGAELREERNRKGRIALRNECTEGNQSGNQRGGLAAVHAPQPHRQTVRYTLDLMSWLTQIAT